MNTRSHNLELTEPEVVVVSSKSECGDSDSLSQTSEETATTVTPRQVEEVTKAIFHTILFHRTTGKPRTQAAWEEKDMAWYSYSSQQSGTFSVGTVGVEDIDCTTTDFTYVRCASPDLDQWLTQQIEGFSSSLCQQGTTRSGKVTLEFYEKKKGRWLLPAETVNWEVWHFRVTIVEPGTEQEWQEHQQKLADCLAEMVLYVSEVVNRPEYVPRNPTFDNLPNIFDVRFSSVQPYLHRVTYELGGEGVAGTVRKFIRDAFAY